MKRDLPERTFRFSVQIIQLCQELEKSTGISRLLSKQLFRSGTSIGANIEEGQAAQSKADFIHKYSISCKEARETFYWIRLIVTTSLLPNEKIIPLKNECNELISILTTIIKKTKEG
ncbi:MAG: four helix bundle protein [Candidatus Marinimicrobia bacterium]|nr:four helix bundle protein [Candidatus Neomarinimicrobiota bacterium]